MKHEADDTILKDGEALRVSVYMMDAAARREPHPDARQVLDDSSPAMADARERTRLSLAWRGDATGAEIQAEARRRLQTRQADAAALARHEAAHDAYSDALQRAWQR
ncbi:MAG: hypothetical protein JJT99_08715 [Rhodobacteraceae bacterium]|nr:hypothetical protein [Paracoccaceae bacterium]